MTEIILSICIATFNRGAYIGETINSILCQNITKEIELVILNSGSTDDTEKTIKSYKSNFIKYIYHQQKYNMAIQTMQDAQGKADRMVDRALKNKKKEKFVPLIEREFKDLVSLADQLEWVRLKRKQKDNTL
jgi:glycosyltransferase involved in cell wall biosynthesis